MRRSQPAETACVRPNPQRDTNRREPPNRATVAFTPRHSDSATVANLEYQCLRAQTPDRVEQLQRGGRQRQVHTQEVHDRTRTQSGRVVTAPYEPGLQDTIRTRKGFSVSLLVTNAVSGIVGKDGRCLISPQNHAPVTAGVPGLEPSILRGRVHPGQGQNAADFRGSHEHSLRARTDEYGLILVTSGRFWRISGRSARRVYSGGNAETSCWREALSRGLWRSAHQRVRWLISPR